MIFEHTTEFVLNQVKALLEAIPLPGGAEGTKLFEKVDFSINHNLRETLRQLLINEARVALIVPAGDQFDVEHPESVSVMTKRFMTFDILIADRDYLKGREAAFGGSGHVGVLKMKDEVIRYLANTPSNPILIPIESGLIEVADEQARDMPGRQCWVVNYRVYAGASNMTTINRRF